LELNFLDVPKSIILIGELGSSVAKSIFSGFKSLKYVDAYMPFPTDELCFIRDNKARLKGFT